MTTARLVRQRARAQAGLLLLALLLVTLTAGSVAGAAGYVASSAREGIRATLVAAEPGDAAAQVYTRLSATPEVQAAAASAVLDETLDAVPLSAHRSLRLPGRPAEAEGRALGDLVLGAEEGLLERVTVVGGTWPADGAAGSGDRADVDGPVALHAGTAAVAEVGVGDVVTVTGPEGDVLRLEVAALWEPRDPRDPAWFGEPLLGTGTDGDGSLGPAVVDEALMAAAGGAPLVRWTVVPDVPSLVPADLARLRDAVVETADRLDDDGAVAVRGLVLTGGLPDTLAGVDEALAAVRGVTVAALLVVGLAAAVALTQVARLLVGARRAEAVVLRSRGTSVAQLAGWSVVEAAVVSTAGAVLGVLGAALVLGGVGAVGVSGAGDAVGTAGGTGDLSVVTFVATAVATALAATTVLGWTAARDAATLTDPARGADTAGGRGERAVRGTAVALVAVGAVLGGWQLVRQGSPVFAAVDGRVRVDPLAVAAVPLALLLVALVLTALLRPLVLTASRRAERRRGLLRVLSLRQLARRSPVHAVTVVLLSLATASGALAAVHAATAAEHRESVRRAAIGTDVRVSLRGAPAVQVDAPGLAAAYRALPEVRSAAAVRTVSARAAGQPVELVALPPEQAADVVVGRAEERRPSGPSGTPAGPAVPVGLPVPVGADEVALTTTVAGSGQPTVSVRTWLVDGHGDLVVVEAMDGPAASGAADPSDPSDAVRPGEHEWTVRLPGDDADRPWRVLAVDVRTGGAIPTAVGVVALTARDAGGEVDLAPASWAAVGFVEQASWPLEVADDGLVQLLGSGAELTSGRPVRLLPGAEQALPLVVDERWAGDFGLAVGSTTAVRLAGLDVDAVVVEVVPAVAGSRAAGGDPDGAPPAALTDLAAVDAVLLRALPDVPRVDEVWVGTDAPSTVAQAAAALAGSGTGRGAVRTADTSEDPIAAPAVLVPWLAAACALLLAVPGVAAAAAALGTARRGEVAVLRALGVGPRQQARARTAELAGVAALAVVGGVLGGLVVAVAVTPSLVRATTGSLGSLQPVVLGLDVPGGLVFLLAAVGAAAVVTADHGRRVRRQASSAAGREADG